MQAPALSVRMEQALAGLRTAGACPTDAEIAWLAGLAARAQTPGAGEIAWVAGAPVFHGGETFWPWTRLAQHWYATWYPSFKARDDKLDLALFAFAHVHSEPGDKSLLLLADYGRVRDAVRVWRDALALPIAQLVEVCSTLLQLDDDDDPLIRDPDKPEADDAETAPASPLGPCAWLCKAFPGTTAEYWYYGTATATTDAMVTAISAHEERGGDGRAPDPNSPRMRAIHNFRMAVKHVLRAHGIGAHNG